MEIVEYNIKVYNLKDVGLSEIGEALGRLLNETLCKDQRGVDLHYNNSFKGFVYNYLYPLETEKIYKEGKVYSFQCRVMNKLVEEIFDKYLETYQNKAFKVLTTEKKAIRLDRVIERVFSTTPILLKNDFGYWKDQMDFSDYQSRLIENMIKKYNSVTSETVKTHSVFSSIKFDNLKPIATDYKGKTLLGDKLTLKINPDDLSQKIIFVNLAFGLGENNAMLGTGFINYKYIR